MGFAALKKAILLEAGFAALWGKNYEKRNTGVMAPHYRAAFAECATERYARDHLVALVLRGGAEDAA